MASERHSGLYRTPLVCYGFTPFVGRLLAARRPLGTWWLPRAHGMSLCGSHPVRSGGGSARRLWVDTLCASGESKTSLPALARWALVRCFRKSGQQARRLRGPRQRVFLAEVLHRQATMILPATRTFRLISGPFQAVAAAGSGYMRRPALWPWWHPRHALPRVLRPRVTLPKRWPAPVAPTPSPQPLVRLSPQEANDAPPSSRSTLRLPAPCTLPLVLILLPRRSAPSPCSLLPPLVCRSAPSPPCLPRLVLPAPFPRSLPQNGPSPSCPPGRAPEPASSPIQR